MKKWTNKSTCIFFQFIKFSNKYPGIFKSSKDMETLYQQSVTHAPFTQSLAMINESEIADSHHIQMNRIDCRFQDFFQCVGDKSRTTETIELYGSCVMKNGSVYKYRTDRNILQPYEWSWVTSSRCYKSVCSLRREYTQSWIF